MHIYTHILHIIYIQFRKLGKWRTKNSHNIMLSAELLKIKSCVQVVIKLLKASDEYFSEEKICSTFQVKLVLLSTLLCFYFYFYSICVF